MREIVRLSPFEEERYKKRKGLLRELFNQDDTSVLTSREYQVYPNQIDVARDVLKMFHTDPKLVTVLVVALCQSGKTGTMLALLRVIVLEPDSIVVPFENIYIITGLSSRDWKNQTTKKLPPGIRIHHRSDLEGVFEEIKTKKNVLIILDENQVASKKNQTLDKCYQDLQIEVLNRNDVKIVEFSATPDGSVYELQSESWGDAAKIIKAPPGPGYMGCFELNARNRVYQYKDLYGPDGETHVREIKNVIDVRYQNPRYHIIRTHSSKKGEITRANFTKVFWFNCDFKIYDGERTEIDDINKDLLDKQPEKHTFIFVKALLRCSQNLTKTHLGVLYERFTENPSDSVIIQGLLGRADGYDDNGDLVVWTNIDSITRYKELWDGNFHKDLLTMWKSSTTNTRAGVTRAKPGFHDTISEVERLVSEYVYEPFDSFEQAKHYAMVTLERPRGPKRIPCDADGFVRKAYKAIEKDGVPRTWSKQELVDEHKGSYGIKDDGEFRYYVCYEDITDSSTSKHLIVYKKRA